MTLRLALALFAVLGLSGCEVPVPEVAVPALTVTRAETDPQPISPARAVALFDAVCGASLPSFATAPRLMAANGITVSSPDGTATVYGATQDVSFQIQDGPGQGRTCSMVFGTTEPPQAAAAAFAGLGQFVETPLGPGTIYRSTQAVVLIGGNATQGAITYLNLRLLSER